MLVILSRLPFHMLENSDRRIVMYSRVHSSWLPMWRSRFHCAGSASGFWELSSSEQSNFSAVSAPSLHWGGLGLRALTMKIRFVVWRACTMMVCFERLTGRGEKLGTRTLKGLRGNIFIIPIGIKGWCLVTSPGEVRTEQSPLVGKFPCLSACCTGGMVTFRIVRVFRDQSSSSEMRDIFGLVGEHPTVMKTEGKW